MSAANVNFFVMKSSAKIDETVFRQTETLVVIPPDGGWGWMVVLGAFFCYFVSDGLLYSFGIFLKDIAQSMNCTESKVSLASAVNTCTFCISGPFSAGLVNRFGYRIVAAIGSLLAATSCVLTSFSNNINLVIVIHGVMGGVGFGMIYITAVIVVGFYFERWRAIATGIAVCGAGIGGISLPPILNILLKKIGWRYTFRVLSCMALSITLFASLFKPIPPTRIVITAEATTTRQQKTTKPTRFFPKYSNIGYDLLLDEKISTITVLEPARFSKNSSSEMVVTNYPSSSHNFKHVDGDTVTTASSATNDESKNKPKRFRCCRKKSNNNNVNLGRPIYRDDIFYGGSVRELPEYKISQMKMKVPGGSNIEYHLSVTRESTHQDLHERKRTLCPIAVKRTIATMLDFRLFRSSKFLLLVCNGAFTSLGFYTPYIFVKDTAAERGVDDKTAFWLISTMGLTNTLGRIFCGVICTIPKVRAMSLTYCFLFAGGIATILSTLCYELWTLFTYCAVYGFAMSSMSALRTIIIVDMLGLDKLTNAIGMILMFQGFATLTGITIAGFLKDLTGDYTFSFYFGGGCITLAAAFLLVIEIKSAFEKRRQIRSRFRSHILDD